MSKDELGRATWMFLHILIVQVILLSLLLFLFCWFSSSCFFYISFFGFIFLQSFQLLQLDYFVLNIQKIQQGNKMIVKNIIFHKAKRSVLALNFMEIYQWPTICFFFSFYLLFRYGHQKKIFFVMWQRKSRFMFIVTYLFLLMMLIRRYNQRKMIHTITFQNHST